MLWIYYYNLVFYSDFYVVICFDVVVNIELWDCDGESEFVNLIVCDFNGV